MTVLTSSYFRRILASLLLISLLPLFVMGTVFITVYDGTICTSNVQDIQKHIDVVTALIDDHLAKATQLLQVCADQLTIKSVLSYRPGTVEIHALEELMNVLTVETKSRLAIHLVSANHSFSSTQLPEQYRWKNFSQTPTFASLDSRPRTCSFFVQPYTDSQERRIVLSAIIPICNYHDHFVGYGIVDLYSSGFEHLLSNSVNLEMALWYDGLALLNTGSVQVPAYEELYSHSATGELQKDDLYLVWNQGDYNKVSRLFYSDTHHLALMRQTASILLMGVLVVAAMLSILIAVLLSLRQSRPILQLYNAMDAVGKGDLSTQVCLRGNDELTRLGMRFNQLVNEFNASIEVRKRYADELRRKDLAALQAQINPHFIYNALGTARSCIRMGMPEKASDIIVHLSTLLHANLQNVDRLITLEQDIGLIQSYMLIQNIRFADRINLVLDIPRELYACRIPSLILQPIVENAIKHGLEPSAAEGTVKIAARRTEDDVVLTIENDGIGIDSAVESDLNNNLSIDGHLGFLNVKRRIELHYGKGYSAVISRLKRGTRVALRIRYDIQQSEEQKA